MARKHSTTAIDPGLQTLLDSVGTQIELAQLLGISQAAISKWRIVPIKRVIQIEQATGIPRHVLRPDFFE